MNLHNPNAGAPSLPFDAAHLDDLMEKAGIDVLLITSKHNIQYLLGGYRYFFHDYSDAIGVSRYLPILIYPLGQPEKAAYVGQSMEVYEQQNERFWTPYVTTSSWGTLDAAAIAIEHLRALGLPVGHIGVEFSFLPYDAARALEAAFPESRLVEAYFPLERLRACKSPQELQLIREASERVVDSMIATFSALAPGMTKREAVARLRSEETDRDLVFEYCLISAGQSLNRAPSDQPLGAGDILSLDSGGRYRGYIGDLCRMGILGEPDAELEDMLAEVEAVQRAARGPIRAGARGGDIYTPALEAVKASPNRAHMHFVAHGMGIVGHEAPRLSSRTPVGYEGYDADLPLQAGMVLSVETTLEHPRRGLIKIEDTLAVTQAGFEAYGDRGRAWNGSAR
ncbi:M24 family metallopeptidase [Chelatococcus sp. GCM10030263]|uniref:M24 family metallopeptidase n=1 Tax=Chelatococcus sp. GCM10030263 TaxID=3273387 RepID=UPI00361DDEC4